MLDSLPTELILLISRHLNVHSKRKLAETCSKMRRILHNTVLFEELEFTTKSSEKIILRFKEKQLDGSHVKSCYINPHAIDHALLSELPTIFPNLQKVTSPRTFFISPPYMDDRSHLYIRALQDKLQSCRMWIGDTLPSLHLNLNFATLRRLTLDCYPVALPGVEQGRPIFDIVSTHLKNAPCLEALCLFYFEINTTALDNLHTHNPKLKHLAIHNSNFQFDKRRFQHDLQVKYVNSLEKIEVSDKEGFTQDTCYMIEYMFKKYTHLKVLALYMKFDDLVVDPLFFKLLESYFSRLEVLKIDVNLIRYFKGRPSQPLVTHLTGLNSCMAPMEPLLNILHTTQGLLDIQAFTGLRSLVLPLESASCIYNRGVILPNIISLCLFEKDFVTIQYPVIELDKLLHTYSHLQELEIASPRTYIVSDIFLNYDMTLQHLSLYKMKLYIQDVGLYFSDFIRRCLPNLRYLDVCTFDRIVLKLDLPHHTLHSLSLDIARQDTVHKKWRYHCHISTELGEKDVYYNYETPEKIHVTDYVKNRNSFERGSIVITCKRLLELKYKDQILF